MSKFHQITQFAGSNGQVTGSAAADTNANGTASTYDLFKSV